MKQPGRCGRVNFLFRHIGDFKKKVKSENKKENEKSRQAIGVLIFCHAASLKAQLVKNPPAIQETPVQFLGREVPLEKGDYPLQYSWVSLVAQLVENLPSMQETWVQSLGWEDPLEKGKATHSSILAWRIPWPV